MNQPMLFENPNWRGEVIDKILELAATGRDFTADDLHEVGEPAHPNSWGVVMRSAEVAKHIQCVGFKNSRRRGRNHSGLRVWRGTDEYVEAHMELRADRLLNVLDAAA